MDIELGLGCVGVTRGIHHVEENCSSFLSNPLFCFSFLLFGVTHFLVEKEKEKEKDELIFPNKEDLDFLHED